MTTQAQVGGFRLEELLGAGGMALVYRAVDERTGEEAALKLLADNLAADEGFRRRFLREARLAARLDHRNVVRVLDSGEHDGRPWIALEYVEGETLAEVLVRRGRLQPDEAAALGLQLCAGLQHAHDAGLVHRDVKPANIVVRNDGSATIVDFGIARAHESTELTEHGSVIGTASYLAPEQAAGGPVTGAADLYSLGAVLFEVVSGRQAHPAASLGELVASGGRQPAAPRLGEIVGGVPAALDEAVARCLEPDPADRPGSADEVARLLRGANEPTALLDTLVLPPQPAKRHEHRSWSRRRAAAVAAALAGALVLAGWLAWSTASVETPPASAPSAAPATPQEQARDLTRWLVENSK